MFDIPEGNCKKIIIEVFDGDKLGKNKSIGTVQTAQKAQPEIKRNTERLDGLDAQTSSRQFQGNNFTETSDYKPEQQPWRFGGQGEAE